MDTPDKPSKYKAKMGINMDNTPEAILKSCQSILEREIGSKGQSVPDETIEALWTIQMLRCDIEMYETSRFTTGQARHYTGLDCEFHVI